MLDESQSNITQLEALSGVQVQAAWRTHLGRQSHGFVYTPLGIRHLRKREDFSQEENAELADIPITLRGRAIGNIALKRLSKQWGAKEKALISNVSILFVFSCY